eukprot:gene10801-3419_t
MSKQTSPTPLTTTPTSTFPNEVNMETSFLVEDEFISSQQHTFFEENKNRTGNLFSSTINFLNTVLGGATLSIAVCFKEAGLITGLILLLFCAFTSTLTMLLLVNSANKKKIYNLELLAYETYGKFGSFLTKFSLFGCLFGTLCAYFVIIADFITPTINIWFQIEINRLTIMILSILFILPLTLIQNINNLRFTSGIALLSLLYVISLVFIKGMMNFKELGKNILFFNTNISEVLRALSVLVFAFSIQFNVLPIQRELYNPTNIRMGFVSIIGSLGSISVYLIMGIIGYLTFSNSTKGNILKNYDDSDISIQIGRLALTLTVLFSYPIVSFPFKILLKNTIFQSFCSKWSKKSSILVNIILSVMIVFSTFLIAVVVPDVSIIFGIAGGLTTR